jgi:predicted DNA-binding protein YlxM (UPF0122 family)
MSDKRDFKKTRSESYQWVLLEAPCAPDLLTEFAEMQSLRGMLNNSEYNEELYDLQDQLKKEFWRLIDTELTVRQRQVLHLYSDGYTQIEIAKKLKVNQSSITKSINGNCDYRIKVDKNGKKVDGNNKKRIYGGAKKKLSKLVSTDKVIQDILRKIAELNDFLS